MTRLIKTLSAGVSCINVRSATTLAIGVTAVAELVDFPIYTMIIRLISTYARPTGWMDWLAFISMVKTREQGG